MMNCTRQGTRCGRRLDHLIGTHLPIGWNRFDPYATSTVTIHNVRFTSIRAIRSLATNVRSGAGRREAGAISQSAAIAHSGVSFLPHICAGLDSQQQLMRLRDLRHFRRRRKAFERRHKNGVSVGGAGGRLIEPGERQGRAQPQAARALLALRRRGRAWKASSAGAGLPGRASEASRREMRWVTAKLRNVPFRL